MISAAILTAVSSGVRAPRSSPIGEASRNGDVSFDLGHVPAGQRHDLWLQSQVNPTTVSHRDVSVELFDGEEPIARLDKTLTVFP